MYYFNARYYDATIGRFINVDPIQDGTNWYVYCNNNPLSFVDPTGLEPNKKQATTWAVVKKIMEGQTLQQLRYFDTKTNKIVGPFGGDESEARYIYTTKLGWIDLAHLFQVAAMAQKEKDVNGFKKWIAKPDIGKFLLVIFPGLVSLGARQYAKNKLWKETFNSEEKQGNDTKWSYEDGPSNKAGMDFYLDYYKTDENLIEQLDKFLKKAGVTNPEDAPNWDKMQEKPEKNLYFPQNKSFKPSIKGKKK